MGRAGVSRPQASGLSLWDSAISLKIGSSGVVKLYQNYDALLVEEVKYVKETRLESVDGIG